MIKNVKLLGVALLILLMASGCGPASPSSGMNQATAHILTLYAVLTNSAPDQNATPSNPIVLDTDTPGVPTDTATLAPTATSAATHLPTVTPTSSEMPTPCYRAYFDKDVTIPDYTKLAAGETFVKTWRLENNGTCDWPADTQVVFISGDQLGAPSSQSIGAAAAVGEVRDVSLTMKAPSETGTYTGYWMLKIPNAGRFGIGDAGNQSFWVIIVVSNSKSPTPSVTKTVGTPPPSKTPTKTPSPTAIPSSTNTHTPSNTPVTPAYSPPV